MNLKLKDLSDQVIVITGASSGIGLVTARMAANRGARVVLNARNLEAASLHPLITGSLIAGLGLAAFVGWRSLSREGNGNHAQWK